MADTQLKCDEQDCSGAAAVFGFPNGSKTKVCDQHFEEFSSQCTVCFDIALFAMSQCQEDGLFFAQRYDQMTQYLAVLASVQLQCDFDLRTSQQCIQAALEAATEALRQYAAAELNRLQQRYDEVRIHLDSIRARLEGLIEDKNYEVSEEDAVLCEDTPAPLFRTLVGDWATAIRNTISTQCLLVPRTNELPTILTHRSTVARRLLDSSEELTQEVQKFALELCPGVCLDIAKRAWKQGHFEAAAVTLLGFAESDFGALGVQANICLAETYYQAGLWQQTAATCEKTLQLCLASQYECAQAHYYLTQSCVLQKKPQQVETFRKWAETLAPEDSLSRSPMLLTNGILLMLEGRGREAVNSFRQGLDLSVSESLIRADAQMMLGRLFVHLHLQQEAQEAFAQASDLLQTHFPLSLQCAQCHHYRAGEYSKDADTQSLALQEYIKACDVYAHLPISEDSANCHFALGTCYLKSQSWQKGQDSYTQALRLYEGQGSESEAYANCLLGLGVLCHKRLHESEQALSYFSRAASLLRLHFPQSESWAKCLQAQGEVYAHLGVANKAEELLAAASSLFLQLNSAERSIRCEAVRKSLRS